MVTLRPFGFVAGTDPFRELRRLQDELVRLSGAVAPTASGFPASGFPAVNVYASQDGIAVIAELPGLTKDDIEVHAHGDTLVLRGQRRTAPERQETYHRRERRSGEFTRAIQLPYRISPEHIAAQLENGVLRLSLPRPQEDKPRRIEVSG